MTARAEAQQNPSAAAGASAWPSACENCGTPLAGPFCHACGQSAEPPTRSVRAFASQTAADLTNLDSRILRTLGLLLARPGRLTREYLDGRRIRYTQPLQLYLGAADAIFAAAAAVYLALALRHVYGQPWLATGLKALGLFVAYEVLLSLWMLSAIAAAFGILV